MATAATTTTTKDEGRRKDNDKEEGRHCNIALQYLATTATRQRGGCKMEMGREEEDGEGKKKNNYEDLGR